MRLLLIQVRNTTIQNRSPRISLALIMAIAAAAAALVGTSMAETLHICAWDPARAAAGSSRCANTSLAVFCGDFRTDECITTDYNMGTFIIDM